MKAKLFHQVPRQRDKGLVMKRRKTGLVSYPSTEPKTKRQRLDDEEKEDRLSDLPDSILLHILSRLNTIQVVRTTCILSTRWKHLWKHLPTLILINSFDDPISNFSTSSSFDKFVSSIMSLRDDSIALRTFEFDRNGSSKPHILKNIAKYVFSHSAQLRRLRLSVRGDTSLIMPCVSSCRALTSLKLSVYSINNCYTSQKTLFPKSLNLPALTTLDLTNFAFCATDNSGCAEPFSAFNNLNSLTLSSCAVKDAHILSISNVNLVNLTMEIRYSNLIKIEVSSPCLSIFTYTETPEHKPRGSIHVFSFRGTSFIKLVGRSS